MPDQPGLVILFGSGERRAGSLSATRTANRPSRRRVGKSADGSASASPHTILTPPDDVLALLQQRQLARARQDWASADLLRQRIIALGWQVLDTPQGPRLEPFSENG